MIGSRPFIEQIERARGGRTGNHFDFSGGVITPGVPISEPAPPQLPVSVVDTIAEGPHENPTPREGMAAVSAGLVALLNNDDHEGLTLFNDWEIFRARLEDFFDTHTSARRKAIENEVAELTVKGKATVAELHQLQTEAAEAHMQWNAAEETRSKLRAALTGILSTRPDEETDFVLPQEMEAWRARRDAAQKDVEQQDQAMRPIRDQINQLALKIEAKKNELEQLKLRRRQKRAQMADGVDRTGGLGLQGTPGKAGIVF